MSLFINNNNVGLLVIDGSDDAPIDNNIYNNFHGNISTVFISGTSIQKINMLSSVAQYNLAKIKNGKSVICTGALSKTGVLSIKSAKSDGIYVKWTGEII